MSVAIPLRTIVAFATGLAVALIAVFVFQAWRVDAAPGDSDMTFVPINPCRLIDTRPAPLRVGPFGRFGADDTKTIVTRGRNGNCTGIPSDAEGVSLNVTAVGASQATFLTVWPSGAKPTTSSLNPTPGEPPTPNALTTKLSGAGAFNMFNRFGTVDVIIDINGYYTKSSLQELADGLATANSRITALESATATNASGIATLDAAQPFARVNASSLGSSLTTTPVSYLDVQVTAPVDGHVVVNYSTFVNNATAGAESVCNVYRSTEIPAASISFSDPGVGWWETAALFSGDDGSVSGTKRFDISAGQTVTYSLACEEVGGDGTLAGRAMTAIFTPSP